MVIRTIHTGFFKLDGGAMFGVVPKRMWAKLNPPDENNMCRWALRALLVETGERKILFDCGIGNKQDEKFRSHFEPHGEQTLLGSLAGAGVSPEEITDVFFTHLHFDHCGGGLFKDEISGSTYGKPSATEGQVKPTFPNAIYWTNKRHFDWAMNPNPREKASFLKENFLPLLEMGKLRFLETKQNTEFIPGIKVIFVNGHTEAMMLPKIETGGQTFIFCADLLPAQWHIGMPYVMAYDIRPLVSLKEKAKLLAEAARKKQVLIFEHDPVAECCTVKNDGSGRVVLDKIGQLSDFH